MDAKFFCNMLLGPVPFPSQMNWPPTVMMWINAYIGGGGCIFANVWPYIVLPLDFILGLTCLHWIFTTIQNIAHRTIEG